ncbi:MAG TPA: HIT domain-containing protein [Candidatus Kapabacteria bacterium]|nr:HIT domain-containing protein [Candidatus Kapabacteria bacterium]
MSAEQEPDGPSPFARAWSTPERDAENFVVHRSERAFIIMNLYPYNAGHLLVVPVREAADLLELEEEESQEMMRLVRLGVKLLRHALAPHAFNIGMNLGRVAGAAIERHVHMHVVPRWNGDTNFMPVLADTRVISEEMAQVYGRLLHARAELLGL